WGEWELVASWGRLGQKPSRTQVRILTDPSVAEPIAQAIDRKRQKKGYTVVLDDLDGNECP
ncbi:MAG: hypothetical protein ACP5GA_06695, partial [Acidithiobacillus sp.]